MNIVTLSGHLGRDLELKQSNSGPYCFGSLALNEDYKDKSGAKVKKTVWVDFTLYGHTAENAVKYVGKKGNRIALIGKLDNRKKEGEKYAQLAFKVLRVEYVDFNDAKPEAEVGTGEPPVGEETPF
jgi:single-strand DNA-binding protein